MKYKTFRALMILAGAVVASGACVGGYVFCSSLPKSEPSAGRGDARSKAGGDTVARPTGSGWDARVAGLMGQPAAGDKKKDALGPSGPKVNLYADEGATTWNRAKVDLDRDEKWDEKWTLKDGVIERQVAPNDDEQYTTTMIWSGGAWTSPGAANAATAATAAKGGDGEKGAAVGGWEARVLEVLKQPAVGDKTKDALGSGGPKVNVYADGGASSWNRAKVDLDRDEKWDEKWTVKDGTVERQIAPNDDEKYTRLLVLRGGAWVEKK